MSKTSTLPGGFKNVGIYPTPLGPGGGPSEQITSFVFQDEEWQKITVNTPSLILPAYGLNGHAVAALTFAPRIQYALNNPQNGIEFHESQNGGVCWLYTPGTWWVRWNNNLASADTFPIIIIPNIAPAYAQMQLQGTLCGSRVIDITSAAVTTAGSLTLCLPHAGVTYIEITNDSANPAYIKFAAAATAGAGYRLAPNGIVEFHGTKNWRGALAAISTGGNASLSITRIGF